MTSLLTLLAAASLAAAPAAAPRRVAVLDFNARWAASCSKAGLTDAQEERCEALRLFADQARGGALAVLRPPAFVVMTRENTAQILKDMGGQCTEGECEVETARLLGASVVVSGEVTFMEGTWLVSIKVHDVATAALLGTGDTEGKSKLEAFRAVRAETERMLKAAVGLDGSVPAATAAAKPPPPPPPPPPPKKVETEGILAIDVAEEGAVVAVDGEEVGRGPYEKELKLVEGTHKLVVLKEGFLSYEKSFRIEVGKTVKAEPKLVAIPAPVPATTAGPAERPAEPIGKRWAVEVLGGLDVLTGGASPPMDTPVMSEFAVAGSYRLSRQWGVGGTLAFNPVNSYTFRTQSGANATMDFTGFRLSASAAWLPAGNRYVSLAFDLGMAFMDATLTLNSAQDSQKGSGPYFGPELRVHYPFATDWFAGARIGLKVALVGFSLRVVEGSNALSVENDLTHTPALALAVGRRF